MNTSSRFSARLALTAAILSVPAGANATVVISAGATRDMNCSGSICVPTSPDAVLSVSDLASYLAMGNFEVSTTGSGVQANNITIAAPFTWSSSNALALDAYKSIQVERPIAVSGAGGLSIATNDGGSGGEFYFGLKGNISFAATTNDLSVNGVAYTLVATLPALASAIAANPSGNFGLGASYDAGQGGKYHSSPIATTFEGNFSGLGNTISNLRIRNLERLNTTGLFEEIDTKSSVSSIRLAAAKVESHKGANVAGLVGYNLGTIFNSSVEGTVRVYANGASAIGG